MGFFDRIMRELRSKPARDLDEESIEGFFSPRRTAWSLVFVLAAAAALRLVNIQAEGYWADEILSLDIATSFDSVREMVRYVYEVEFHPPLYYLVLRGWVGLFGAAEWATRSLSMIVGLGQIVVTYLLARDLTKLRSVGLGAAFLMAVTPFSVEFGQEARPYTMILLAGTLAAWAMWRQVRGGGWRWAVLYVTASLAGLYLNYSYIFVALSLSGWWFVEVFLIQERSERWSAVRTFVFAHAAVFLGFFPWLPAFLYKLSLSGHLIFGLPRFTYHYRDVGFFSEIFDRLIWSTKYARYPLYFVLLQAVFKASFLVAFVSWVSQRRFSFSDRSKWLHFAFLGWSLFSVVFLFVASPMSFQYSPYFIRHFIFALVPLVVIASSVLVGLGRKGVYLGMFVVVSMVPSLGQVISNDTLSNFHHRYGLIGEYIAENRQEGDLVIVVNAASRTNFAHYLPDDLPMAAMLPLNHYGLDFWGTRHTLGFVENDTQVRWFGGDGGNGDSELDITKRGIRRKLEMINKMNEPRRVWLVGVQPDDSAVEFYEELGWHRGFFSLGTLFPVELFVNIDYAIQE